MKRIFFIAFLALTISVSFSQVDFKQGTVSEILAMAKEQGKPVMVDVWTDWCVWCVELDNLVYARPEVYEYANNNIINFKIDAEKGEGVDFAKKYSINGFPTILFLDSDGNEIDRLVGYFPAEQFKIYMTDYSSGVNTVKDLEAKLKANSEDFEALYKMAEKKLFSDKPDEAKQLCRKIIDSDPGNSSGRKDDAELMLAHTSEKVEIVKNLEAFIMNHPRSDVLKDAYIEIGSAYLNVIKDNSKAEKWYKEALAKYPGDEAVGLAYSRYLNSLARTIGKDSTSREDDYKKALAILDQSLPYAKNSTAAGQAYYWQSVLHYNLKDYGKSMESIDNAIKIFNNKTYREQKEKVQKQLSSK